MNPLNPQKVRRYLPGSAAAILFSSSLAFAAETATSYSSGFLEPGANGSQTSTPTVDEMSPPGLQVPASVKKCMVAVEVEYFTSKNSQAVKGRIIVNRAVAAGVVDVFKVIKETRFPITLVQPVNNFGFSDPRSMAANNTSAFNYRRIANSSTMSNHSYGRAIDINPKCNPQVFSSGRTDPPGAHYDPSASCAISEQNSKAVIDAFKRNGWTWGGSWGSSKDYQHFEKKGGNLDQGGSDC